MTKQRNEIGSCTAVCLVGAVLLLGAGCASTQQFVPKPDMSAVTKNTVHVEMTRAFSFSGFANPFRVVDDGQPIGDIGPGGSLLWERQAGTMHLVARPVMGSMGDFDPVEMVVTGPHRYTFKVSFPFFYPMSRNAIEHFAVAPLTVTKSVEADSRVPRKRPVKTAPLAQSALAEYPHRNATAAILTFDARAGVSIDEAALLADRFSVELGRMEVYRLISRSKMKEVLELQQYSAACTSVECAVEAGQLLGVEYMIHGSIGRIGSLFTINVYITSVEKGSVVAGATVDYSGEIEGLLTGGMQQAVNNLLRAVMKKQPTGTGR